MLGRLSEDVCSLGYIAGGPRAIPLRSAAPATQGSGLLFCFAEVWTCGFAAKQTSSGGPRSGKIVTTSAGPQQGGKPLIVDRYKTRAPSFEPCSKAF